MIAAMICFRLLDSDYPAEPLAQAVAKVREGENSSHVYSVSPTSFRQVPNAPFAYWVSEKIRGLFCKMEKFGLDERTAKQGVVSADDFRFVRTSWETKRKTKSNIWFLLAKGGSYSVFYSDVHLLINWNSNGAEIRYFGDPSGVRPKSRPQNTNFYFKNGLTWTNSTTRELSVRALPKDCIFSHMGPTAFAEQNQLLALLSWFHAKVTALLIDLQLGLAAAGRKHYEVGIIQRVPTPKLNQESTSALGAYAHSAWSIKRSTDTANQTSHAFYAPALSPSRTKPLSTHTS